MANEIHARVIVDQFVVKSKVFEWGRLSHTIEQGNHLELICLDQCLSSDVVGEARQPFGSIKCVAKVVKKEPVFRAHNIQDTVDTVDRVALPGDRLEASPAWLVDELLLGHALVGEVGLIYFREAVGVPPLRAS
jgi:hypothetical protein